MCFYIFWFVLVHGEIHLVRHVRRVLISDKKSLRALCFQSLFLFFPLAKHMKKLMISFPYFCWWTNRYSTGRSKYPCHDAYRNRFIQQARRLSRIRSAEYDIPRDCPELLPTNRCDGNHHRHDCFHTTRD